MESQKLIQKSYSFPYFQLDNMAVAQIAKIHPPMEFNKASPLFYEDQTPIVAYLLMKGHIQLLKNKKVKKILQGGEIVGLRELIYNLPSPFMAKALPNAKLSYLDRSSILEILEYKRNNPEHEMLREKIESALKKDENL